MVDQPSGVYLFGVHGPMAPTALGHHPANDTPARSASVADDGRLYVVYERTGLIEILDIADPETPRLLGSYDAPGRPPRVTLHGSTLYIPDGRAGVRVVDVTDPATPRVVGVYDTPGVARGVAVSGSHVFVADGGALVVLTK